MKVMTMCSGAAFLMIAASSVQASTLLFSDDFEGGFAVIPGGGAAVTVGTDPSNAANSVGEIDITGGNFVNIGSGSLPLPAGATDVTLSLDWSVPDEPAGDTNDFFFLQIDFIDAVGDTISSVSGSGAGGFQSIASATAFAPITTGPQLVPAGTTQINTFAIIGNGGASAGTALLVDNYVVETTAIPEPTSLVLLGLSTAGVLMRRRR